MLIRAASPKDIPAITAIYAYEVLNGVASYEITPPDEAEMLLRFEAVKAGGFPYIVAEINSEVVGYAYAGLYAKREGYRFTVEDSIYVRDKGKGIGKALLKSLLQTCEAQGKRQMIAVIGDLHNHGSIALHRSLGFTMVGVIASSGFKHGRWVDTVLMQRALGEGELTHPIG
jgi:L-amino acid N-acyltransferase YncA